MTAAARRAQLLVRLADATAARIRAQKVATRANLELVLAQAVEQGIEAELAAEAAREEAGCPA